MSLNGFVTVYLRTAAGGYVMHSTQTLSYQPESVQLADVTGDGKLDAIVTASGGSPSQPAGSVTVFAGDGKGDFAQTAVTDIRTGSAPQVSVADVNGDGHPDLVVTTRASTLSPPIDPTVSNNVTVYLDNGKGSFPTQGTITGELTTPTGPIQPADLVNAQPAKVFSSGPIGLVGVAGTGGGNGAFPSSAPNYLVTLKGDGRGNFALAGFATVGGTFSGTPLLGDFNGDGNLDIAITETDSFGYTKLLIGNGNGKGSVTAGPVFPTLLTTLVLGDVNGDGRPDIVGTDVNGTISGYLNGPGEKFTATSFGINGTALGLVDMNGDNKTDLIIRTPDTVPDVGVALHL